MRNNNSHRDTMQQHGASEGNEGNEPMTAEAAELMTAEPTTAPTVAQMVAQLRAEAAAVRQEIADAAVELVELRLDLQRGDQPDADE